MVPYKGKILITCTRADCLRNILTGNVQPSCMDCTAAVAQIVDLDDKVVFEYQHDLPPVKTGSPIKPAKPAKTKGRKSVS